MGQLCRRVLVFFSVIMLALGTVAIADDTDLIKKRAKDADLVISGEVYQVADAFNLGTGRFATPGPDWKFAYLKVFDTLKGDINGADKNPVIVVFPTGTDSTWASYWKFETGQQGVWLLRWENFDDAGTVKVLMASQKIDRQPLDQSDNIRKMLKKKYLIK